MKKIFLGEKMNISKIKSIIPNFKMDDFFKFDKILFLKWETVFDNINMEENKNLLLGYHSKKYRKNRLNVK